MNVLNIRSSVAVALLLFLIGCSSHPRRVDCEGRLSPINAPAKATTHGGEHR